VSIVLELVVFVYCFFPFSVIPGWRQEFMAP
jgi:hypothetical protein